jgi:hypothetical protein
VSLPRFFDRLADAATPLLGGLDRGALRSHLEKCVIQLRLVGDETSWRDGFLLAVNLAARIYPSLDFQCSEALATEAAEVAHRINPQIALGADKIAARLVLGGDAAVDAIAVSASGWNVFIDSTPQTGLTDPEPLAALVASCIGVGELFRSVFAEALGERGRQEPRPWSFNAITLGDPEEIPAVAGEIDLADFIVVGAGAIGQAALYALRASGASGRCEVIDAEPIVLSNLQRYVLSFDSDEGTSKTSVAVRELGGSRVAVEGTQREWDASDASAARPVLVGVDSADVRIAIQSSLPSVVYNAYTQPADLGWSRHEAFGEEPCLACLYWPEGIRPHRHEMIAESLKQHPLRVLAYLVTGLPAGMAIPLDGLQQLPGATDVAESEMWTRRAILNDVAAAAGVEVAELDAWRGRPLADLYHEGICGGGLLSTTLGDVPHDVLVPLAHQSALAGIFLAIQLVSASHPTLAGSRPVEVEGRYDVLTGPPQVLGRKRLRTTGCLCDDAVIRDVYREKFATATEGE